MPDELRWWQRSVIYQVVVPSFLDTNGDGMGDLPGVISRLEYLEWLGVDAVWLSPIYASPMADMGYDVTDFTAVDARFGTLEDFDRLVDEAHRRRLKVLLDWVPNHSSDEHPWFMESRSARESSRRDWYVWRDPRPDGSPPTNWISVFGGSAWEWDEATRQYYLHMFLDKQPDLNWRNPGLRAAMLDGLRFWLDRGVDGFRIDGLGLLLEDVEFRDNPPNPDYKDGEAPDLRLLPEHTLDQPGNHDIVASIRAVVEEYENDRLLMGELYLPVDKVMAYYGERHPELHLPMNMRLAWMDWNAGEIRQGIQEYRERIPVGEWPVWAFSCHDCSRFATRLVGEQTRIAAMLLITLGGTAVHYYGEEIGMRGTPIPPDVAIDPQGRRTGRNRDPERTPMQWNAEVHAGFSTMEPWLPICEDFPTANVAAQSGDPRSLLSLYRRLFALRREEAVLVAGTLEFIDSSPDVLAYRRTESGEDWIVALNFSGEPRWFDPGKARLVLSTFLDRENDVENDVIDGPCELRGNEGLLLKAEG